MDRRVDKGDPGRKRALHLSLDGPTLRHDRRYQYRELVVTQV